MRKLSTLALIALILAAVALRESGESVVSADPGWTIPYTGFEADHEGSAAWNTDATAPEPAKTGHTLTWNPAPGGLVAYYYMASADYDGINPNSTGALHGGPIANWNGFPQTAAALADNGFTPDQLEMNFGLMTLGGDVQGVDWTYDAPTNTEVRHYNGGDWLITLNGEPLVGGAMPTLTMTIDYNVNADPFDDDISGITAASEVGNQSAAALVSSPGVQAVAAAFLSDVGNDRIRYVFGSIQPSIQSQITLNGRSGAFFEAQTGQIEIVAGPPPEGAFSGTKYNDANGNGQRDAGEAGLPGWTIYVDLNDNGQLDANEPSQVTDASGAYEFTQMASGDYVVREVQQAGWTQTAPQTGFHDVNVDGPSNTGGLDFGNKEDLGAIHGYKYRDDNANGIRDDGEPTLPSWTIYLDLNNNRQPDIGEPVSVTDDNGEYWFMDLPPGTYSVAEVQQPGWWMSTPDQYYLGMSGPTNAQGFGLLSFNPNSNELFFDVQYGGVASTVTGFHIHVGGEGENGPILYDLGVVAGLPSPISGSIILQETTAGGTTYSVQEQAQLLDSGGLYLNLHSQDFLGGEIRGQIMWNGFWEVPVIKNQMVWENLPFGNVPPQPPGFIETDVFEETTGSLELIDPSGNPMTVMVSGQTTVKVYFDGATEGSANDDDNDGLDEIETEIVSMDLTGFLPGLGTINLRLDPSHLSTGMMVERENANPGTLDVAPFAQPSGGGVFTVDSFFDVYVEITIPNFSNSALLIQLRPEQPLHIGGPITHKPPREGEMLMSDDQAEPIRLLLPNDEPSGWMIGKVTHTPNPAPRGFIHGAKWDDRNGNGVWDDGEPGLPGWKIYVDMNGDGQWQQGEPWAETMDVIETGRYWIEDVPEGQWKVREVGQQGWVQTYPLNPDYHMVTVVGGSAVEGVDFGNMAEPTDTGSIHGEVWDDKNGNGVWDDDEVGLPGWKIYVDMNGDGQWQAGEPWAETMDDDVPADDDDNNVLGMYWIVNVPEGEWMVREVPRPGWVQTHPLNPDYHMVTIADFEVVFGVVFGNMVEPTDGVCGDLNGDGRVNLLDALTSLQIAVGWADPTPEQIRLGDFDGIGGIDVLDVITFLQYLVGKIDHLDCGPPHTA